MLFSVLESRGVRTKKTGRQKIQPKTRLRIVSQCDTQCDTRDASLRHEDLTFWWSEDEGFLAKNTIQCALQAAPLDIRSASRPLYTGRGEQAAALLLSCVRTAQHMKHTTHYYLRKTVENPANELKEQCL